MGALSAQELRRMQSFIAEHNLSIKAIFAIDSDSCLGYKDRLIYQNLEDLKFFKTKTLNHAVIMGRKTFDSIGKKPLPDRLNIVVTHDPDGERAKFKETKHRGVRRLVFIKDYLEIPHILYQRNMRCGWVIGGKQILGDLFNLINTFVVTEYACSAIYDSELGLFEDEDDFDPNEIIRISEIMRRMRSLPRMKLMPSQVWESPSGKNVRYTTMSYTRTNPKIAAKLADLKAEELMDYNRLESERAEEDIKQHLRKSRY